MTPRKVRNALPLACGAALCINLCLSPAALALQSDRQQPLEVTAASTDGLLGDGLTVLRGDVDIRQGSLHIRADLAEVAKQGGKVQLITLRGSPAYLEQEIEEQGLVQAEAETITYQVGKGLVELQGEARVEHPQYQINGDQLTYDLDAQHFEGTGSDDPDGRIRIRLDPEVAPDLSPVPPDSAPAPVTDEAEDGADG